MRVKQANQTKQTRQTKQAKQTQQVKQISAINYLQEAIRVVIFALVLTVPTIIYIAASNPSRIKTLVFNIGIMALFGLWMMNSVREGKIKWAKSPLNLPVICFIGWNLISALTAQYYYASFNGFGRLATYVFMYYLIVCYFREKVQINRLLTVTFVGAFLTCVYGMLQHYGIDWVNWYPKEVRIISSLGNPTFFAAYLVILIPISINLFLENKSLAVRVILGLLSGLMYLCLLFTYTRAAWLGLMVAVAIDVLLLVGLIGFRYISKTRATLYAGIMAVFLVLLTVVAMYQSPASMGVKQRLASSFQTQEASNVQRIVIWKDALTMFKAHPAFGVGVGCFEVNSKYMPPQFYSTGSGVIVDHSHNELLEQAAETGVVGVALFLWLCGTCIWMVVRVMRNSNDDYRRYLAGGLLCGLIAFMIQNMAGLTMRYTFGGMLFWMALAIIAVIERPDQPDMRDALEERVFLKPMKRDSVRLIFASIAAVSIVVIGSYLAINTLTSEIHLKNGDTALTNKQWQTAYSELTETVKLNPYSLAGHYKLAFVYNQLGQYDKALKTYRHLQTLSPDYAKIHYNLAVTFLKLGRYNDAIVEYKKAIHGEDSPVNHMGLAEVYRLSGNVQASDREADEAVRIIEKTGPAAGVYPADMYLRRGGLFYRFGRLPGAMKDYRKVISLRPNDKEAHYYLGCCYRQLGQMQKAVDEYEIAHRINPQDENTLSDLGAACCVLKQFDRAAYWCRAALEVNPTNARTHYNLGVIYAETGKLAAAKTEFDTAARLGGNTQLVMQAQETLNRMSSQH